MEAYFSFAPIHESKSLWNMFPNIGDEVKTLTQSSPSLNPNIDLDHVISKT